MSTDTLLDAATELAYLVRCEPPAEVHRALTEDINPADKDALLVVLACLVDIDRPRTEHAAAVRQSPVITGALSRLDAARIASYEREYTACTQHGDRDPEVMNHARQYATAQGVPWTG